MHTTSSIFLNTLAQAGITHAFVNWGNDHPAMLEELERQRVEDGSTALQIITCPNEMVALSAAQGFTQVTGKPSLVIVHVDVGTQALAGAVHNVDKGRTPVVIFAGAAPFSGQGELKGSKNEWPMWGQDAPDQAAIVRQYMRYTAQIMSGKNVAKVVMRALQFATSGPQGPVYLYARREILEEEFDESVANAKLDMTKWPTVEPSALSPTAVETIFRALCGAKFPLILLGHTGRNIRTFPPLVALSEALSVALFMASPSVICVPYSHPNFLGSSFGGKNELIEEADVIIILDTDVPWIDTCDNALREGAKVFIIDSDPLKQGTGWSHVDAELISKADSEVALKQLLAIAQASPQEIDASLVGERAKQLASRHADMIARFDKLEASLLERSIFDPSLVLGTLREAVFEITPSHGQRTLWLNESISSYPKTFDHIRPDIPGSMICSGGSSLGWALGAAVGASLGAQEAKKDHDLVVVVVGDGTYLFGVPSSAYWMARRYNTPHLTVILNNGGWASPRNSMMGIYPTGYGSKVSGSRLSTGFGPDMPDFAQIATAAGGAWGKRVSEVAELRDAIREAIQVVLVENRCAVLDCVVQP